MIIPSQSSSSIRFLTALLLFVAACGVLTGPGASAAPAPAATDAGSTRTDSLQDLLGKPVVSIQVSGNRRIEKEAILAKLSTRAGAVLTREAVRTDIKALFEMGFFDDIAVQAEPSGAGVAVSYLVRERPVISDVEFEGNERISTDDLKEVSKIKQWAILDINQVKDDVQRLQKHYEEKGFFLARVDFDVKKVNDEEVKLIYRVHDYEKVRIKKITFLNNRRFTDTELKGVLGETTEGGVFSAISGSGNFKESSFKNDLQRLTFWYLDHGYVKFRYENPTVTVSDDKKWLFITVYVEEGEQYKVEGIPSFGGDLLFPEEDLRESLTLREGETFSISKRNLDIQRLTEKYQDKGYAFVNVIPKMNIKDDSKTIEMSYDFEKGNLVHFGEIRILGNLKTYDKVIRRELKIFETQLYSGTALRQSRENVERLGFFAPGEVVFNTVSPKGRPDLLDVEITVKERSTGTVTLGAGYGSVQGFFFTGQVSENNLFGRGQTISLSTQLAKGDGQKSFNLGFTEPYTFDSLWTTGFDIFFVNFPIPNKFATRRLGFNLRGGYPVAEFTRLYATYKFEDSTVRDAESYLANNGLPSEVEADEGLLSSVIFSLVRDKRNNRFETTGGNYQSASLELAGVGGDKRFAKYTLNNRVYQRLVGDLVFRNSIEFGQIFDVGGRPIPPSERFYLGGPNNLRGFRIFAVGPIYDRRYTPKGRDTQVHVREPLGGDVELYGLFELEYPLIREAGLKGVVFFDAGNIYQGLPDLGNFTLRSDVGWGIRWFSPIGPLRFEFGYPLNRQPSESPMEFQFFIGTPF